MKFNDYGPCRIANIPKDSFPMLVKGSSRKHSRNVCADQLDAMPPAIGSFGIVTHITNMFERNVQLTLACPQLVQAFHFEVKVIVGYGNVYHVPSIPCPSAGKVTHATAASNAMKQSPRIREGLNEVFMTSVGNPYGLRFRCIVFRYPWPERLSARKNFPTQAFCRKI